MNAENEPIAGGINRIDQSVKPVRRITDHVQYGAEHLAVQPLEEIDLKHMGRKKAAVLRGFGQGQSTAQRTLDPQVVESAQGLRFLVLDELHTYRGRQGADVAMLIRRVRNRLNPELLCVGTSATMSSEGSAEDRKKVVAEIASRLFGCPVAPQAIITETLDGGVSPNPRKFRAQSFQKSLKRSGANSV